MLLTIINRPLAKINIQSKIKDMKYEKIANYSGSKFRRITGVKRSTFEKMVEILKKEYASKHQRRGRHQKLSIEDLLLATLEYLRNTAHMLILQRAMILRKVTFTEAFGG